MERSGRCQFFFVFIYSNRIRECRDLLAWPPRDFKPLSHSMERIFVAFAAKAVWECRKLQQLCMGRLEKQKAKSICAQSMYALLSSASHPLMGKFSLACPQSPSMAPWRVTINHDHRIVLNF
jgi:hypothetical protein